MDVIAARRRGRHVHYKANIMHPRWLALRQMVQQFADPADVIRDALAAVPGVDAAFVFGSLARGDAREDSDVDVFTVGQNVDEMALSRETLEVNVLLDREVDALWYTPNDLVSKLERGNSFIERALVGPKRWIIGGPDTLPAKAASLHT